MNDMPPNKDEEKKNLDKENSVETKEKKEEENNSEKKVLNIESEDDLKELLDELFSKEHGKKPNVVVENVSIRIFSNTFLNILANFVINFLLYFALLGLIPAFSFQIFWLHFPMILVISFLDYFTRDYFYKKHILLVIKSLGFVPILMTILSFVLCLTISYFFVGLSLDSIGFTILFILLFIVARIILVTYCRNLVLKIKFRNEKD